MASQTGLIGRLAVHYMIREGNTPALFSLIQSSKAAGMQTMDASLLALVEAGEVRPEDGYLKARDKALVEAFR